MELCCILIEIRFHIPKTCYAFISAAKTFELFELIQIHQNFELNIFAPQISQIFIIHWPKTPEGLVG